MPIHMDSGVHPASHTMDTGSLYRRESGKGLWLTTYPHLALIRKWDLICTINQFILEGNWGVYRCFLLYVLWKDNERIFFVVSFERCWFNRWCVKYVWNQAYVLFENGAKFRILYNRKTLTCSTKLSNMGSLYHRWSVSRVSNLVTINVRWPSTYTKEESYLGSMVPISLYHLWSMCKHSPWLCRGSMG